MTYRRTQKSKKIKGGKKNKLPRTLPAFLNKLHTIVNDPTSDHIVSWSSDGVFF